LLERLIVAKSLIEGDLGAAMTELFPEWTISLRSVAPIA
jgi:hypothetical protein